MGLAASGDSLAGTRKHFTVINMETSDFKEFKQLFDGQTAPYINKKKDAEGGDFFKISDRALAGTTGQP